MGTCLHFFIRNLANVLARPQSFFKKFSCKQKLDQVQSKTLEPQNFSFSLHWFFKLETTRGRWRTIKFFHALEAMLVLANTIVRRCIWQILNSIPFFIINIFERTPALNFTGNDLVSEEKHFKNRISGRVFFQIFPILV